MYSQITTATVCGLKSVCVQVEADVCDGMPVFEMVGFLSSEVKEAREREERRKFAWVTVLSMRTEMWNGVKSFAFMKTVRNRDCIRWLQNCVHTELWRL